MKRDLFAIRIILLVILFLISVNNVALNQDACADESYQLPESQNNLTDNDDNSEATFKYSEPDIRKYSLNEDRELMLSKDFKVSEFRYLDGSDEILIDIELVRALQYIRDYFDKPLHINSAYRTEEHNAEIGGCEESYNLLGRGVDFYVEDIPNLEVAVLAELMGIKGIIVFTDTNNSLHIDSREEQWYAYYSHEDNEYLEVIEFNDMH